MKKKFVIQLFSLRSPFILIMLSGFLAHSQTPEKSAVSKKSWTFYGCWGYNKDWYTKSNIRMQSGPNANPNAKDYTGTYDFTVYGARAHDRDDFNQIYDVKNITIPQFGMRVGVLFNDKYNLGFEINYDHAKYVVYDYQNLRVKGQIFGQNIDKDTVVDPQNLLHFEHTDGANFWAFNLVKRFPIWKTQNENFALEGFVKGGPGFVYPRTDVTLFGHRVNNEWKLSGYCFEAEGALRLNFVRYLFLEFSAKGVYAHYVNAIVQGRGYGKASHKFGAFLLVANLGFRFGGLKN
jgi:hypothetical protein